MKDRRIFLAVVVSDMSPSGLNKGWKLRLAVRKCHMWAGVEALRKLEGNQGRKLSARIRGSNMYMFCGLEVVIDCRVAVLERRRFAWRATAWVH